MSDSRVRAPHPPLKAYYGRELERRAWVIDLFDATAADYERLERLMALGSGSWYRRQALRRAGLLGGMHVIDVGVGTGLVAREAARLTGDPALVIGVDPSPGMVTHARVPPGVRLLPGMAESLPTPDAVADFLCMGYAMRHISDLPLAFREFHRVLKPGGRLCLLEITAPRSLLGRAALKLYIRGLVPLAARWVARGARAAQLMRYYWDTIEACVPPACIVSALEAAGFVEVHRAVELGIFSEFRARRAP